jgi:hypothetical protein
MIMVSYHGGAMFFRQKKSGTRVYLQIVENRWERGASRQRVVATLGRLDRLREGGQLEALLQSGAKFCQAAVLAAAHRRGSVGAIRTRRIGPVIVLGRLWNELGIDRVLERLLEGRQFEFPLERAVFLTVLHRLLGSGSDRAAEAWREDYDIPGTESLKLHHLYRAMAWLGEELSEQEQAAATPFAPRCTKDVIEEALFARRRDLFSQLELVFFDTTSLYFEGEGGETMGAYGYSKDHRPDRKQMIVGAVLDGEGRPVCCELWPGNISDAKALIPIVDRLRSRFQIGSICVIADRGMISKETIRQLQGKDRRVRFILGARMRAVKEIAEKVMSHRGRYREVYGPRRHSKDPAPLKVKEVLIEDRRYIVCHNQEQAEKDRADRETIVAALEDRLRHDPKSLVGNKGYRKYLKTVGGRFEIDQEKLKGETRFDGKWVLQTDMELSASETALKYKELLFVESLFRSVKSILHTRPIYHKCDETIRGHVFCSFLALLLRTELMHRLEAAGSKLEWADIVRDLDALQYVDIEQNDKRYRLRSESRGVCGTVFAAVGVAFPPTIQQLSRPSP